jgi:tetratricopeptide (TPR) repeat protein
MKHYYLVLSLFLFSICLFAQQGNYQTSLTEAQSLKSQGKLPEAVFALRQAVQQNPNNAEAHFQFATYLGELSGQQANKGDFTGAMTNVNEAFAELDKAVAIDPNHFQAHVYYGVYALNIPAFFGKLEPGVIHLEKAKDLIQKNPSAFSKDQDAEVYRYLGQGYKMQGKPDAAESAWNMVLTLLNSGENADAAKKGLEGLKADKAKATQAAVQATAAQSPQETSVEVGALMKKGQALLNEKKWYEAAAEFRKVIEKDTANIQAYIMLIQALGSEASGGYNERIYQNQDYMTNLAFEVTRMLEKAYKLDPNNTQIKYMYAMMCIRMPFFVGRIDEGLSILESMSKDPALTDSLKSEVVYQLGFGYRKKGKGIWANLVQNNPKAKQTSLIYDEFGLREFGPSPATGERVQVTFHLGFQDELAPQTGLWIEDKAGKLVKTLYVSGFSGHAREKQVVLPKFAKHTNFETDGTTSASIDWGTYTFSWDMTDHAGKRVKPGVYKAIVEISWWPSMRYETAEASIQVGGKASEITVAKPPLIPRLTINYLPK